MKKTWVVRPEGEDFYGYLFRGKETFSVEGPQKVSAGKLRGEKVLLIIEDERAYFHREAINRGPKEIIALQISERVKNLGFIEGAPRLAFKIEEVSGSLATVSYLALPLSDIEEKIEQLVTAEVRLNGVLHHGVALAGLGSLIGQETVLLAEALPNGIWIVITHGKKLLYLRYFGAEESEGVSTSHVEEALLAALDFAHRGLKKEVKKILPLGPQKDLIPPLPHLETISLENLPFKDHLEDLIREPAFFGALFAPEDYDLIPEEHRLWLKHLRPARIAAFGLLFFILANFIGSYHFIHQKRHLLHEVALLEDEVRESRNYFNSLLAGKENDLERLLELKKRFSQEPRVDLFLAWLARHLPNEAHIFGFKAENTNQGIHLHLEIAYEGPFFEAQKAFSLLAQHLSTKNSLLKSRLTYEEEINRGVFVFEFFLKKV